MSLDYSLARAPDLGTSVIDRLQAGREAARSRAREAIMARYGDDPAGAIQALWAVDPEAAITLRNDLQGQKDRSRQGEAEGREAHTRGMSAIANALGAIQRRTKDPEERRRMAIHAAQLLGQGGALPPQVAAQLRSEVESFDFSDASIESLMDVYPGPFAPVEAGGALVDPRAGRTVFQGSPGDLDDRDPLAGAPYAPRYGRPPTGGEQTGYALGRVKAAGPIDPRDPKAKPDSARRGHILTAGAIAKAPPGAAFRSALGEKSHMGLLGISAATKLYRSALAGTRLKHVSLMR